MPNVIIKYKAFTNNKKTLKNILYGKEISFLETKFQKGLDLAKNALANSSKKEV